MFKPSQGELNAALRQNICSDERCWSNTRWSYHCNRRSQIICNSHWWTDEGYFKSHTAWKVSRYGVFSSTYFPAFGLNTERYFVSLCIQSECGENTDQKNFVFGHFSRSASLTLNPKKCQFGKKHISIWGMIYSADGGCSDLEKVEALNFISPSTCKEDLISFLSIKKSNSDFILSFFQKLAFSQEITKGKVQFRRLLEH